MASRRARAARLSVDLAQEYSLIDSEEAQANGQAQAQQMAQAAGQMAQAMQQQPVPHDGGRADQRRVAPRNPRQRQRAEAHSDVQELSERLIRFVWLNR